MQHEFRIGKAQRFLAAGRLARDNQHWETCVSRGYYAIYHLVVAVLIVRRGVDASQWRHAAVRDAFIEHFCKPGYFFSDQDGKDMTRLLEDREDADYHDVTFNDRRARRSFEKAETLANKVLEVLQGG